MRKKRVLSLLMVCVLLIAMAGCSGNGSNGSATSNGAAALTTENGSDNETQGTQESGSGTSEASTASGEITADETIETDILIIGGGGTGLSAALSAAEAGKQVLLIEKMGILGGATAYSAGKVPAAGTKQQEEANIEDSAQALAIDILRPGDYSQRKDLVELVANNAKDFIEWSEEKGVVWNLETDLLYNGQTAYRMHVAEGGGEGLVESLKNAVNEFDNITIMMNTTGTGLVTNDAGEVIGATAEGSEGETLLIQSRAVILATSGFGANREMVEEYIPSIANAYPMVAPGATGEGILWGLELGAGVRNMSSYQGYAPVSMETKAALGQTILNSGGILVNKEGYRFMDEVAGYSNLATAIVNQTDAYAYMIFDKNLAEAASASVESWREAGILIEADTAAELAEKTGVNAERQQIELELYQQGIEAGKDYLERSILPAAFEGPYYAVQVTGDFRHTQGGLTIDLNARVLKEDGTAVPGLYAGGGVTEGFSSTGGPGYMSGNGLLQALVIGKLAGEEAAEY